MGCVWSNVLDMTIISHPLKHLQTWEHFLLFPPIEYLVSLLQQDGSMCLNAWWSHEGPP